jgi:hypothetical protein
VLTRLLVLRPPQMREARRGLFAAVVQNRAAYGLLGAETVDVYFRLKELSAR